MTITKNFISVFAVLSLTACTLPPGEDTQTTDEASALRSASAGDGAAAIDNEAAATSAAACHGTTTCPGGTFIANGPISICGPISCSNFACGKPGVSFGHHKRQARETYASYVMPGGLVCLAYQPMSDQILSPCCLD